MIGSVTINREDGVRLCAQLGDLVHPGDMIETGSDGAVLIAFADGTVFTLSNDASMALSEFLYAPDEISSSALFELRQGAFAFNAGRVAKSGRFKIDTPSVMLQARAQGSAFGFATLAVLFFASIDETRAARQDIMFLEDGTIADYGIFELLTKETVPRVIRVDDPSETIIIRRAGSGVTVNRVTNSPSQMEILQDLSDTTASIGESGGSVGSGTPPDAVPFFQPINLIGPNAHPALTIAQNSAANNGEQQFMLVPNFAPPAPTRGAAGPQHRVVRRFRRLTGGPDHE